MEVTHNKINSWKNKFLSFAGRIQLIAYVLTSMQVYWCSLFILPLTVCDNIDNLMSNFLWANKGSSGSMISIKWVDACRPKNQGGLGLKSMYEKNIALMAKHLWNIVVNKDTIWVKWVKLYKLKGKNLWEIEMNRGMSWSWKHLLDLKDKIKEFVNVKLGNGRTCSVWFDKWHPRGPLSSSAKVVDMIEYNSWNWPIDWTGEYDTVLDVSVPVLNDDLEDKVVWCNKKNKEKYFSVSEVWKAIRIEYPKVIWYRHVWFTRCIPMHAFIIWIAFKGRLKTRDRLARWFSIPDMSCVLCKEDNESHSYLFFSCNYSKRLWERLKPMALLDYLSNNWAMERNVRRIDLVERNVDILFNVIVGTVRLKLMSLTLKRTSDVMKAADIWKISLSKNNLLVISIDGFDYSFYEFSMIPEFKLFCVIIFLEVMLRWFI
nr:hypothetical protein [Tanacetum cinerariifolium]